MIDANSIQTISDLRFRTKAVMKKAAKNPVYVFYRSTPQSVLMSVEKYQEMLDIIEDYFLSLKALEYEKEAKKSSDWITEKELIKQLKI